MKEEDIAATSAKARQLFGSFRLGVRQELFRRVSSETRFIQELQVKLRTPLRDAYFQAASFMGSHTFYMIGLPICFWLGFGRFAFPFL